ncbi:baseplate hub/hypothetical structural protein [Aeromonas phage Gekk3-15]
MEISVKTLKNVIQIQNTCEISITGLREDIRHRLLTSFTAWNLRKRALVEYVQVEVFGGYSTSSMVATMSRVFIGDVVKCDISGAIPNFELKATAFTRQVDRTNLIPVSFPTNATFKTLFNIIADAAGLAKDCDTSYDGQRTIGNFGVFQVNPVGQPMRFTVNAAIVGLSALFPDSIAIWVDDDKLIARDIGKAVGNSIVKIDQFVDAPPAWNEWGVTGKTFFNPSLRLGGACEFASVANSAVNGQYVITQLEYDLTTRKGPFHVMVKASPPARSQ